MRLSVITLSYNTLDLMQQFLARFPWLPDCELIIVDNASTDGSVGFLSQLADPRIRIVFNETNVGFAAGNNKGLQVAQGEYVLLLNSDAFPERAALETLLHFMEQHPRVAIAGPQLLFPNGRWQRSYGGLPSLATAWRDALGLSSLKHLISRLSWPIIGRYWSPTRVPYVDGACMLLLHSVLKELGGLDERFFFFVEDAEICARVQKHDWQVYYVPQSQVVHLRGSSSSIKSALKTARLKKKSLQIYIKGEHGVAYWERYRSWMRRLFAWRLAIARIGQRVWPRLASFVDRYQRFSDLWGQDEECA